MATSKSETDILLSRASTALSWARMDCRGKKSRHLLMIKGRTVSDSSFTFTNSSGEEEIIPSIATDPTRFLGKVITATLSEFHSRNSLKENIADALTSLDKCFLLGTDKVWIVQYLLLPRSRWPLMIHEFPLYSIEAIEQSVSKYLRKWLGLRPTISKIALYSKQSPCPLALTSLSALFKTSKTSGLLQLQHSRDPLITSSTPVLDTGSTWDVQKSVKGAKGALYFKNMLGHTQNGKAGLGFIPVAPTPLPGTKEYRKAVADAVAEEHDHALVIPAYDKPLQHSWLAWSSYIQNDLRWKNALAMPPGLLQFCINSTYNTLPSPSNLVRWQILSEQSCTLCSSSICTLKHILADCNFSLRNGRWKFRHDSILKVLVEDLDILLSQKNKEPYPSDRIAFIKEGSKCSAKGSKARGLLDQAKDWILLTDL